MNTLSHLKSFDRQLIKISSKLKEFELRYHPRMIFYRPKNYINYETKSYQLVTATTVDEFLSLFKMRYSIFLNQGFSYVDEDEAENYDYDDFDFSCDHLLIKDKSTRKIVGTYRLQSSSTVDSFYAQTEFNIDEFLALEGAKLELGRACINVNHRNGKVIDLLWRGIGEMIKQGGEKYLFGCSSVYLQSDRERDSLINYFNQRLEELDNDQLKNSLLSIKPLKKDDNFGQTPKISSQSCDVSKLIPPLLKSYMLAGAVISPFCSYDEEFRCFDFITVLDTESISSSFKKRYFQ